MIKVLSCTGFNKYKIVNTDEHSSEEVDGELLLDAISLGIKIDGVSVNEASISSLADGRITVSRGNKQETAKYANEDEINAYRCLLMFCRLEKRGLLIYDTANPAHMRCQKLVEDLEIHLSFDTFLRNLYKFKHRDKISGFGVDSGLLTVLLYFASSGLIVVDSNNPDHFDFLETLVNQLGGFKLEGVNGTTEERAKLSSLIYSVMLLGLKVHAK